MQSGSSGVLENVHAAHSFVRGDNRNALLRASDWRDVRIPNEVLIIGVDVVMRRESFSSVKNRNNDDVRTRPQVNGEQSNQN